MFTVIIGALWVAEVLTTGDVAPPDRPLAVVATLGLVVWAVLQYRRAGPEFLRDALVLAAITGMVLSLPNSAWIYGPAFLVVFQRTLDTRGIGAWVWTLIAFTAFEAARLGEEGVAPLLSLSSLTTLIGYGLGAMIMRTLARITRAHERAAAREADLSVGVHELLTARSTTDVAEVAIAACLRVASEPDAASSSVWERVEGSADFRLLAAAGPVRPGFDATAEDILPDELLSALRRGDPVVTRAGAMAEVRAHVELDAAIGELVLLPVVVGSELTAIVAVGLSGPPDPDLVDVLGRFSAELSLAWERVELLTRLESANAELRRADELKNQFVSMVSHELRTPLTAICGFAETLTTQWPRLDDERRLRYTGIIARQAGRQRVLVEDLLTMSRILSGKVRAESEPVVVAEAVHAAAEIIGLPVVLAGAGELRVHADPHHLEQVLTNLFVNADKYGAPPYLVDVSTVGDRLQVHVVDHGPGVDPGFQGALFDPFAQQDVGDRRTASGVGLGLAICRDLLAENDGTISYRETPGGGATFVIELPAA